MSTILLMQFHIRGRDRPVRVLERLGPGHFADYSTQVFGPMAAQWGSFGLQRVSALWWNDLVSPRERALAEGDPPGTPHWTVIGSPA